MSGTHFLSIAAVLDNLSEIRHFIAESTRSLGASPSTISDLQVAVDEAVTNVSIHGYGGNVGHIELEVDREGEDLVVRLRDKAPPFDPAKVLAPKAGPDPPRGRPPLGVLGVYLIKEMVDEMRHRSIDGGGNELILVKREALLSRKADAG